MWGWACGGAVTAAAVGVVLAGGRTCHCGPCLGQPDGRIVTPPPAPKGVVVRFDEPPLARRPAPGIVQASFTEPANRYSAPGDPF